VGSWVTRPPVERIASTAASQSSTYSYREIGIPPVEGF
jgi:hypothetical protein